MIAEAARRTAYFFTKKNIIKPEEEKIYAYGYEILISEAINWVITIIIALLTGKIAETVVYMLAFMRLRGALGGYHANSHWGCILISTAVYAACLAIAHITPPDIYAPLVIAGLAVHAAAVFKIAPVAHPNKPFSCEREYDKFRKKSLRLSTVYSVVCAALIVIPSETAAALGFCVLLGMLSASVSMVIEHAKQKNKRRKEV